MGPLIILAGVVSIVTVVGFAIYGALLGLEALGQDLKRLFWPQTPAQGGRR